MTGFGEARRQQRDLTVSVEVRAINGRYFKLGLRATEGYSSLEPLVEGVVRRHVKRGNVQVQLRVERALTPDDYRINGQVLQAYHQQLEVLCRTWQVPEMPRLESLLLLPGVVSEVSPEMREVSQDWPVIERVLVEALEKLAEMRAEEGTALMNDLADNCRWIAEHLDRVHERAPQVAEDYRERLSDRVNKALGMLEVTLNPADLLREVSLFGERSDVSEEIVRLRSHLEQFEQLLGQEESSGRKLEFLTQEMFREANTIGSKSNDVEISREVIDIKASIERMREQIQNVE
jgi:uncharacterized protein (TIGR00255 family)